MRFVKRKRSNPNEASLHPTIHQKLGNGGADWAVDSFNSPSTDPSHRDQRRSCASGPFSVSSTHRAIGYPSYLVLDEARVPTLLTSRSVDVAQLASISPVEELDVFS